MFPSHHLVRPMPLLALATAMGLLLPSGAVTTIAVAVQQPPPPSLAVEPLAGPPGRSVTATARDFTGCLRSDQQGSGEIAFAWDGEDELNVVTIEDGAASTTFLVPQGAAVAAHRVVARCVSDATQRASAEFMVTPVEVPPVIVPNVVGLSTSTAASRLKSADLVLGTVTGDGARVETQDPEAGTETAPGTPVDLTMTPAAPVLVRVPDLDGRDVSGARATLESVGLLLGSISGDGTVVSAQSPRAGVEVPRGSTVAVTVVPVTPRLVVVPDLVGRALSAVPGVLSRRGLVLGQQSGEEGVVRSQNPQPGSRVPVGSAVSVSLEPDLPPPRLVRVPELRGMTLEQAEAALAPLGLVLAKTSQGDRVTSQEPAAGTMVPRSTSVILTMSAAQAARWPAMAAAVVVLAGGALIAYRLLRSRLDSRWLRHHVHLAPGEHATPSVELSEPPANGSAPTVAVRLKPHADSGRHMLEEVPP